MLRRSSTEPTEDFDFADEDETCRPRLTMSGALYESMLVVETSATGDDICERSMRNWPAFRLLDLDLLGAS